VRMSAADEDQGPVKAITSDEPDLEMNSASIADSDDLIEAGAKIRTVVSP